METMFNQEGQVVHGAQFNVGGLASSSETTTRAAMNMAMDMAIRVDKAYHQATVEVFAPEDGGLRGLSPIAVIYERGKFDHIRVCDDLDDGDAGASLEAWIKANGDECWATLDDHRGGPTLSLRTLAAEAARLSEAT